MKNTYTTGCLSLTNLALGTSPMMLQTLPADRQEVWQASAVWGTKSAEDFRAPWEASAVWGTKSADLAVGLSVRLQHKPDLSSIWMKPGYGASRMIH